MKHIGFKQILIVCSLLFAACSNEDRLSVLEEGVSFTTYIETRAGDTQFDNGDKISVFAATKENGTLYSTGNYADNSQYVYSGEKFEAYDNGIELPKNNGKLQYHAVYPYQQGISSEFTFSIKEDQSTYENYTASDLMTAVSEFTSEQMVKLKFKHRLSKINVITEGTKLPAGEVNISLVGMCKNVNVNLNAHVQNDKELYTVQQGEYEIKMCPDGTNRYKVVIPAQSVNEDELVATICGADGKKYPVKALQDYEFKAGKSYTLYIAKEKGVYYLSPVQDNGNDDEYKPITRKRLIKITCGSNTLKTCFDTPKYDDKGRLLSYVGDLENYSTAMKHEFSYNSNSVVINNRTTGCTYTYTLEDGVIISAVKEENSNIEEYTFEYNNENRLVKIIRSSNTGSTYYEELTWQNNNLVRIYNSYGEVKEYTYSNDKAYTIQFYGCPDYSNIVNPFLLEQGLFGNSVSYNLAINDNYKISVSYEIDKDGYVKYAKIKENGIMKSYIHTWGTSSTTEPEEPETPEEPDESEERFDDVVPEDIQDDIEDWMPIHMGVTPPRIEGTYFLDPQVTVYCEDQSVGGYDPGQIVNSEYLKFSNQNMSNNTLDLESIDEYFRTYEAGEGAFIAGTGNNFTAFFNTEGYSIGEAGHKIYTKLATVISGTYTSSGIKDLYYAFVMVDKQNDINDELMNEGIFRIFRDQDGLSVNTTWPLSGTPPTRSINKSKLLNMFKRVK